MKNEIVVVLPHRRFQVSSLRDAISASKGWSIKLQQEVIFFARSKKHNLELKATFSGERLISLRTKWNRKVVESDEDNRFYDIYQNFLEEFHLW